ncbi:MAG: anti-sigma factor [Thermomicrobiales bacterium]
MEPGISEQEHRMYRELLGAYALGAVTPEEFAAVESHLEECDGCRAEIAKLRSVVGVLPLTVEEREPPPRLRDSILAAVAAESPGAGQAMARPAAAPVVELDAERRRRYLLPWAAAAAMLLLSIGLLAWNFSLRDDPEAPEPMTIAFEPMADDVDAGAEAMWMEDAGVIKVWLTDAPALASNEVYQVWMIHDDSIAVSAGVMTEARAPIAIAANPSEFEMLAITREPGPMGMPSPTSDPILTGHFETA